MNIKRTRHELQNLISGKSGAGYDALIQTISRHLRSGKKTGPMAEGKLQNKGKETAKLLKFAEDNNLLIQDIDSKRFIGHGAEQKVYINGDDTVI